MPPCSAFGVSVHSGDPMLSRTIRAGLLCVVAARLTLASAATAAQPHRPTFDIHRSPAQPGTSASASAVYSQPPSPSGGLLQSSWWDPDESNYDQYVWDNFTLQSTQIITEVHWRGGYDPAKFGSGGLVLDFTVAIYPSIAGGSQPDVVNPPLVNYQIGGDAGETSAGSFGGVTMYDYTFTLPAPFQAEAGTKYWVQIEAWQHGMPDWGITRGTGGNGMYFRRVYCDVGFCYQIVSGDAAFTLLGPSSYPFSIYLPLTQK
jgi:hypothetical protein